MPLASSLYQDSEERDLQFELKYSALQAGQMAFGHGFLHLWLRDRQARMDSCLSGIHLDIGHLFLFSESIALGMLVNLIVIGADSRCLGSG